MNGEIRGNGVGNPALGLSLPITKT